MLDAQNASAVAGGETHQPPPFVLEGLFVQPPTVTRSSQASGDDSTILRARVTPGRVRLVDHVLDESGGEYPIVVTSGSQYTDGTTGFALNAGVWATAIAIQHRPAAAISIVWVLGAVASVAASAAKPTVAQIEAALDAGAPSEAGGEQGRRWCILGDVLFTRAADQVVWHTVSNERRPAYVDEDNKTSTDLVEGDNSNGGLGERYWGYIDFPVALAGLSGVTPGQQGANIIAPALAFGGRFDNVEYIPSIAGAGASADITVKLTVGATPAAVVGLDLQITLATSALGQNPSADTPTSDHEFFAGEDIGLEVDAVANAFSAGEGIVRAHIYEYLGN